jgi:poly(3-hydroxybutyrate) depolymerase
VDLRSEPPLRDLWSRSQNRFLRQWLVLGPIARPLDQDALAAAGSEASLAPAPDQTQASATGEKKWTRLVSFGNEINIASAVGSPTYRGSKAEPEVAYAYNLIHRETAGDAELSIGSEGAFRVWVNGVEQHPKMAPGLPSVHVFTVDAVRFPVRFNAGDNRVLLKLEHRSGPWIFALRVMEKGALVSRYTELSPSLDGESRTKLRLRTDSAVNADAAPVQVAVVAAGGKVMARGETARGEVVTFDPSGWADGPYEFQLVTRDAAGNRSATYVPWYQGDALATAKGVLASKHDDPHEQMLVDMIRDRIGGAIESAPSDVWPAIHSPLMEMQELALARAGNPGPVRPSGFVRLSYVDEVDGSTQFCRVFLPAEYSADRRWPLILSLHGFNPPNPRYINWWSVDERHSKIADKRGVIYAAPFGRGNAQYRGIGEKDVLRCLTEAKKRLSVDDNRVYLTGESMGGAGTWLVSTHNPELFAAAAPVYGGWDFRLNPALHFDPSAPMRMNERFLNEAQSTFAGAEGLLNVALFVTHGDSDPVVSVLNSRHAVNLLQRWGYDIRYHEMPGWAHEDLQMSDEIAGWLLTHTRNPSPREVRLRAVRLEDASAHWVQVRAWNEPLQVMRARAEVMGTGRVQLETENVASVLLSPPREWIGTGQTLRVVWNGEERSIPLDAKGTALVSSTKLPPGAKRPELEGGLSSFFTTPFVIVRGTASRDAEMLKACKEETEKLAQNWQTWQHVAPRVLTDKEVTPDIERKYSLLLVGGADANLVSRRMASKLPLQVTKDSVTLQGRKFKAVDAVAQMIYPSPSQPDRYVLLVAATSAAGMRHWDTEGYIHRSGFPLLAVDWMINDRHRVTLEDQANEDRHWIASGAFDMAWRRDDRYTTLGDEKLLAE